MTSENAGGGDGKQVASPPSFFDAQSLKNEFAETWNFETDNEAVVTFSDEMDSGNLHHVEQSEDDPSHFFLWIRRDCQDTEHQLDLRSWFYFSIRCTKKNTQITITVQNMNTHKGLMSCGYRPVMCVGDPSPSGRPGNWQRIFEQPEHGIHKKLDDGSDVARWLRWTHEFTQLFSPVHFAFCYPYPLSCVLDHVQSIRDRIWRANNTPLEGLQSDAATIREVEANQNIYFHVNQLASSLKGRPVHLITVSSMTGISSAGDLESDLDDESTLFPGGRMSMPRHYQQSEKRVCFISSRVHPGETPASFIFEGFLDFITNPNDPRAKLLRDEYVFKLIPCLNPDGVVDGHYRSHSRGLNLNRCYLSPDPQLQPTIFASKRICQHYADQKRLLLFLDLHAHANRKGMFCFGNQLPDVDQQVQNEIFPWLVAVNSPHMDVLQCDFSVKNLKTKSRHDNLSNKKGAGRAAMWDQLGVIHSYTLESHYLTGVLHKVTDTAESATSRPTSKGKGKGKSAKKTGSKVVASKRTSKKPKSSKDEDPLSPKHPASAANKTTAAIFDRDDWRYLGKSAAIALLDLAEKNPHSRLPTSTWKSADGLRQRIRRRLELKDPYRKSLDQRLRKPKGPKSAKATNREVLSSKVVKIALDAPTEKGARKKGRKKTTAASSGRTAASHSRSSSAMSQVSVSSKGSDVDERFADLSLEVSTKAHTVASPTSAAVEKRNSPIAAGIGTRSTPNLKAGGHFMIEFNDGCCSSGDEYAGDDISLPQINLSSTT